MLLSVFFASCSNEQAFPDPEAKKVLDSLSSSGKHGYYPATYIRGRIKSVFVTDLPFRVEVKGADKSFLGKPIAMRIDDSTTYHLSVNTEMKAGYFDSIFSSDRYRLLIRKTKDFPEAHSMQMRLKDLDYEIRIYEY
jgi:hypothetical protein